jgi:hypothetical protein
MVKIIVFIPIEPYVIITLTCFYNVSKIVINALL